MTAAPETNNSMTNNAMTKDGTTKTGAADAGPAREPRPDFVVVGAMKAGTTTLAAYLDRHPGLHMAHPKEPQFFSRPGEMAARRAWYRGLFEPAGPGRLRGEASTCYSRAPHHGDVAGLMHAEIPDAKLVYILRHPIERAHSHYAHLMKKGVTMTFEQALDSTDEIADTSDYAMQIDVLTERFPRERLHVMLLDDLDADQRGELSRLCAFLGVADHDMAAGGPVVAMRRGNQAAKREGQKWVRALRSAPLVGAAIRAMPRSVRERGRRSIAGAVAGSAAGRRAAETHLAGLSPMTPETRARLAERLLGPTTRLEAMLGRDLAAWKS